MRYKWKSLFYFHIFSPLISFIIKFWSAEDNMKRYQRKKSKRNVIKYYSLIKYLNSFYFPIDWSKYSSYLGRWWRRSKFIFPLYKIKTFKLKIRSKKLFLEEDSWIKIEKSLKITNELFLLFFSSRIMSQRKRNTVKE